jgi:hypothetical protein
MSQSNSSLLFAITFEKVRKDYASGQSRIKATLAMISDNKKTLEEMAEWLCADGGTSGDKLSSECLAMATVLIERNIGRTQILELFSHMDSDDAESLLGSAYEFGDSGLVDFLEKKDVGLSSQTLLSAVFAAYPGTLGYALDNAYEIDQTAMIIAAVSAQDEQFKMLINHPRIDLSTDNKLIFRLLANSNQIDRFDLALAAMEKKTAVAKANAEAKSDDERHDLAVAAMTKETAAKAKADADRYDIAIATMTKETAAKTRDAKFMVQLIGALRVENGQTMSDEDIQDITRILSRDSK